MRAIARQLASSSLTSSRLKSDPVNVRVSLARAGYAHIFPRALRYAGHGWRPRSRPPLRGASGRRRAASLRTARYRRRAERRHPARSAPELWAKGRPSRQHHRAQAIAACHRSSRASRAGRGKFRPFPQTQSAHQPRTPRTPFEVTRAPFEVTRALSIARLRTIGSIRFPAHLLCPPDPLRPATKPLRRVKAPLAPSTNRGYRAVSARPSEPAESAA
jgi:hypothetical protein